MSPFDPAQAAVEQLRVLPFGESQVDGVAAVLHTAGAGVYPDGSADGTEPLRFLHWQVGNLATEAANGGGIMGATLDSITGRIDGVPPISYLIAAWVSSYPSPAEAPAGVTGRVQYGPLYPTRHNGPYATGAVASAGAVAAVTAPQVHRRLCIRCSVVDTVTSGMSMTWRTTTPTSTAVARPSPHPPHDDGT